MNAANSQDSMSDRSSDCRRLWDMWGMWGMASANRMIDLWGAAGDLVWNPRDSGVRGFYICTFVSLARLKSLVLSLNSISYHISSDCNLRRTSAFQFLAKAFFILIKSELGCYR